MLKISLNIPRRDSNALRIPVVKLLSPGSHDRNVIKLFPVLADDEMNVPIVSKINQVAKLSHLVSLGQKPEVPEFGKQEQSVNN